MTYIRQTLLALCITTAALGALAQNPEEHQTHHPENTPPSTVTVKKTATGTMTPDKMAAMDQHMKLMQGGISMMKQMGSQSMNANMADRQQMMEKRMDMMQSMMQMMMDCMPPSATK